MKFFLVSLLLLGNSLAARAEQTYRCSGRNVSGTIHVSLTKAPSKSDPFPAYTTRSDLRIGGSPVELSCSGDLSYFEREIPFGQGAWRYDESIWVLALCGANLGYSQLGEGFHLEVSGYGVRGYLGHRDHLQGPENLSAYDFRCR